jgi:hypothetical protein
VAPHFLFYFLFSPPVESGPESVLALSGFSPFLIADAGDRPHFCCIAITTFCSIANRKMLQ